jgi:uncharacterized OB-fold protein
VRLFECVDCGRTYVADGETCPLCGRPTKELTGDGRGRLTSWTTVFATSAGVEPYVLGWAELDDVGVGVLGRFLGDASAVRRDLPLRVHQTAGNDGWPQLWLEPEGSR